MCSKGFYFLKVHRAEWPFCNKRKKEKKKRGEVDWRKAGLASSGWSDRRGINPAEPVCQPNPPSQLSCLAPCHTERRRQKQGKERENERTRRTRVGETLCYCWSLYHVGQGTGERTAANLSKHMDASRTDRGTQLE